jgi:hypothetical protein
MAGDRVAMTARRVGMIVVAPARVVADLADLDRVAREVLPACVDRVVALLACAVPVVMDHRGMTSGVDRENLAGKDKVLAAVDGATSEGAGVSAVQTTVRRSCHRRAAGWPWCCRNRPEWRT